MILGLRHVGIVVLNLRDSLYFYETLLGLKVVTHDTEHGAALDAVLALHDTRVTTVKLAADDGTQIELLRFHSHERGGPIRRAICEPGISHVSLTVDDVEATHLRLRHEHVRFLSTPRAMPSGAIVAFCLDPDLNHVELVEPPC